MKIYGLLASLIIILILLIISIPVFRIKNEMSSLTIITQKGEVSFDVEIADSEIKRTIGLMNRTTLPEKSGMLFIFNSEITASFWMKNTLISLDMVFISENKTIINIKRNAQPCKTLDCETYKSERPVKYVLEINGGLADKLNIKEGNNVKIIYENLDRITL